MATEAEIRDAIGAGPGSLGPVNLPIPMVIDRAVAAMSDFGAGANIDDKHYFGINWERDVALPEVADLRNVVAGDPAPGRLRRAGTDPRHRGGPYLPARHQVFRGHERRGHGRGRPRRAPVDGLLRHRCLAHRGRGHRAEPRRPGHHLARAAGPVLDRDPAAESPEGAPRAREGRIAVPGTHRRRRRCAARRPSAAPGRDVRRRRTHRHSARTGHRRKGPGQRHRRIPPTRRRRKARFRWKTSFRGRWSWRARTESQKRSTDGHR